MTSSPPKVLGDLPVDVYVPVRNQRESADYDRRLLDTIGRLRHFGRAYILAPGAHAYLTDAVRTGIVGLQQSPIVVYYGHKLFPAGDGLSLGDVTEGFLSGALNSIRYDARRLGATGTCLDYEPYDAVVKAGIKSVYDTHGLTYVERIRAWLVRGRLRRAAANAAGHPRVDLRVDVAYPYPGGSIGYARGITNVLSREAPLDNSLYTRRINREVEHDPDFRAPEHMGQWVTMDPDETFSRRASYLRPFSPSGVVHHDLTVLPVARRPRRAWIYADAEELCSVVREVDRLLGQRGGPGVNA